MNKRLLTSCSKLLAVSILASLAVMPAYAKTETKEAVKTESVKTTTAAEIKTTTSSAVQTTSQSIFVLNKKSYTKDGQTYKMDAAPQIVDKRIVIPVKYVGEALNAEVKYDNKAKKITLTTEDKKVVVLTVGKATATVDGKEVDLGSKAFIEKSTNRTFVPVASVGKLVGVEAKWDNQTKSATFN